MHSGFTISTCASIHEETFTEIVCAGDGHAVAVAHVELVKGLWKIDAEAVYMEFRCERNRGADKRPTQIFFREPGI